MNTKLSMATKFSYGFGMTGECLAMNTFYIYFLYFLTDAVGMSAGIAGVVAMIGTVFGAFTDLYAGRKSDNSINPKGRRRPMIFKCAIFLCVAEFLLFTDWSFMPTTGKIVYFTIICGVFWFALSLADIPYQSLGAELTSDYEEENSLRGLASALMYVGNIGASTGVLALVAVFSANGGSVTGAWSKSVLVWALLGMIAYWIVVAGTKGKEPKNPNIAEDGSIVQNEKIGYMKMVKDALAIKDMRKIILYVVIGYCGLMLYTCAYVYYLSYNMGMTEVQVSLYALIYTIMTIVASPIIGALKFEKKNIVAFSSFLVGAYSIVFHFIGLSVPSLLGLFLCVAIWCAAYFVSVYSLVYDVCVIDEYKTGESKAAGTLSVFYFFNKAIGAFSMLFAGAVLSFAHYDASLVEQTAETLNGISVGVLLVPGVLYIIGGIVALTIKINKKNNAALIAALEAKAKGEEYSEEDFKEVL